MNQKPAKTKGTVTGKQNNQSQTTSHIPALRRQKQENHEFKASLVCLKSQTEQQPKKKKKSDHISEYILSSTSNQDLVGEMAAPKHRSGRKHGGERPSHWPPACALPHSSCSCVKSHLCLSASIRPASSKLECLVCD